MLTRDKFNELVERIDKELSGTDLRFHQRPLHAFSRLTKQVDPKGTFHMGPRREISENDFSNDALCAQVHRWYEERYGDRIKIHMGPGSYVLMIRNEPWEVIYPLCYGRISFVINSDLQENRNCVTRSGQSIPSVNILCHVKHMTFETANSLSDCEKQLIMQDYMFGLNAVQALRSLTDAPFMEQAATDYDISVRNIFYKYPDYNNSKWSALQFAEKTMKSKLQMNKIGFKHNHDLGELAEKLKPLGLQLPLEIIQNIQCKAGVRYGEEKVSRNQAIVAIRSALTLFSDVFNASAYSY